MTDVETKHQHRTHRAQPSTCASAEVNPMETICSLKNSFSESSGSKLANMAPSSSGSWDGAGADIIDLDRYMRGGVRPSRALSEEIQHGEQLVVDCGKPNVDITTTRYKHYSHDSGVSDGSYRQLRTRRLHRRTSNPTSPPTTYREPPVAQPTTPRTPQRSSDSLRQFKTVCEQVLVDQQKQIARVAEMCERLERAENGRTTEGQSSAQSDAQKPKEERLDRRTERRTEKQSVKSKTPPRVKSSNEKKKEVIVSRQSSETSGLSSSTSRTSSDRDVRKTDKHRTSYAEECKTYKIIMRKLDELNRRFGPQQRTRRPPPSSSSVSVCDKLVATDPTPREAKTMQTWDSVTKERLSRSRAANDSRVTPVEATKMNGVKERIVTTNNFSVKYESSSCRSVTGEEYPPTSPFDLNDPMRFYAQAKHLQAMAATATTRRTHSVDIDSRTPENKNEAAYRQFSRTLQSARSHSRSERDRSPSLCAVCRAYLRSLRQCLIAPLTDYKVANT